MNRQTDRGSGDTGRLEAFSDGVFAIATTLLILEVEVPHVEHGESLWSALGEQWPSYAAYVVSFLVIGIIWVNHHQVFGHVIRVDRKLMFLNLLLLMIVAALPWPTALLAEYLRGDAAAAHTAAAVYSLTMVAMSFAFQALWWHLTRSGHLFHPRVDPEGARGTRVRFALGSLGYPATVALAFVSAPLTLAAHGVLALYYGFNQVQVPARQDPEAPRGTRDLA
ncbi:TMEM175 family protein [Streptomyces endophyticus]|uniref:TMEM175 family protein n=1 Tax=Streptomyces endophyticus TaxID=714166 RepID=A0ABU6EXH2_9ACTN|nr:TMEM175 family protein [Streptomyces endophyticus]MEB8336453.1 TMEM175 family protein [Streptomyces endophyticus]